LKKRQAAMVLVTLLLASPALAGPGETARAQEQSFDGAILACNPEAAAGFYEDDAVAIYPGENDIAVGRNAIGKLLKSFSQAFCPNDQRKSALKDIRLAATPLGADYILVMRIIDATDKQGNHALFRSTRVLHRSGSKWRYLSDHTSVGLAAAGGSDQQ